MVKTPIEIADNIMNEIAEYVTSNLKVNTVGTSFARLLRETLDRKFGPAWHVFVGKNFGCFAIMIIIVLLILNIRDILI